MTRTPSGHGVSGTQDDHALKGTAPGTIQAANVSLVARQETETSQHLRVPGNQTNAVHDELSDRYGHSEAGKYQARGVPSKDEQQVIILEPLHVFQTTHDWLRNQPASSRNEGLKIAISHREHVGASIGEGPQRLLEALADRQRGMGDEKSPFVCVDVAQGTGLEEGVKDGLGLIREARRLIEGKR